MNTNSGKREALPSPQRVLIIRLSSIGDIVLTFPLLQALHQAFPQAKIDYVVRQEYTELLRAAPPLHHIWTYNTATGLTGLWKLRQTLKEHQYDVVLDLHRNIRSLLLRLGGVGNQTVAIQKQVFRRWLLVKFKWNTFTNPLPVAHKYLFTARRAGLHLMLPEKYFFLPQTITKKMQPMTQELLLQNFRVVMAPGARHATKQWPAEYYQQLIQLIFQQYGWRTILLGSATEAPLIQRIARTTPDLTRLFPGNLSLLESAALIEALPYFISNDSGLMHIAAALHKPQLAFFGPTVREFGFFPLNDRAIVLEQKELTCRPCSHLGTEHCPLGHFRCMRETTPEQAFQAFQQLVKSSIETH